MLIAAIIALWGALGGAVAYIRYQYNTRMTDIRESHTRELATRDTIIADRDRRIERLEARNESNTDDLREQLKTAQLAVSNSAKQNELIERLMDDRDAREPTKASSRRSS